MNITQAINNDVSAEDLYSMYKSFLGWEMSIKHMALFIRDQNSEQYSCVSSNGLDDYIYHFDIEPFVDQFDKMKYVNSHPNEILSRFDVVIPVFHNSETLALSLIGGTVDDGNILERLQFIITITNVIVVAIQNKRLLGRKMEQEMLRNEMLFAMQMQNRLMPTEFPNTDKLDLHGYYQPKLEVGGDYYDYFKLSDDEIVFCIADISGKGVAAALLMSNIQATLRTLLKHFTDINGILREINETISKLMEGDKFASMFLAKYNIQDKELAYINAGHNPPLLLNVKSGESAQLEANCSFLGSTMDFPDIEVQRVKLTSDSILMMYTDGLTEITNVEGVEFSLDLIEPLIKQNKCLSAFNINAMIVKKATEFAAKDEFIDDLTLLTCKLNHES